MNSLKSSKTQLSLVKHFELYKVFIGFFVLVGITSAIWMWVAMFR